MWPARRRCRPLFSHNDQQSYWQALAPEGASSGWAGRLTDLLLAGSATSGMAGVTAGGNTVLLAGRHSSGYRVGPQDRPPSTCCATGSTAPKPAPRCCAT